MPFIKKISYYLPEQILSNEDLVKEFPEWTVEKIASKVGVSQRHIADENETASDMGIKAAEKLFTEHEIDRNSIDFLLFCTQSPDYFMPTSAAIIQDKLGLSTNCGAIDYNLGCSGFVYGLSLAKGLILGGIAKNVLLITAETYSKHIHPKDKGNRTIFGDAATATLISTEGFAKIDEFVLGTDGKGKEIINVKTGGMRQKLPLNDLIFDENNNPISSDHFYMKGSSVFNFTADIVPKLVDSTLKTNNLRKEDIDLFIFHQANKYMINYLRKIVEIEEEKFFINLENMGNTVSCTIPIAIVDAQKEGILKGNILLASFGIGYSWGAVVIRLGK